MKITSRHNPKVKQAASLRSGKQRRALGLTLVDGPRETLRAIAAGVTLRQLFVCREDCNGVDATKAIEATEAILATGASDAELLEVSPEVFERIAYGDRTDGVVAVVEAKPRSLADLLLPPAAGRAGPLIAVVEGVEKPGNLGAILRTADGAGVDAVVAADPMIDLFNPNVIRASVGAVFKPNVAVASAEETLAWLRGLAVPIYAARPDAEIDCFAADFTRGAAIVLGNEASGLTDLWSGQEVTAVSLPMRGIADSLNVSATGAVVFYEALRQRQG